MKELHRMTKEELVAKCRRLQSENYKLQDELGRLSDCYTELENAVADKINSLDAMDTIKDVDWFKRRLLLDGLLTPQLESFIEDYLKFYNT
jgi:hypothetical protein